MRGGGQEGGELFFRHGRRAFQALAPAGAGSSCRQPGSGSPTVVREVEAQRSSAVGFECFPPCSGLWPGLGAARPDEL